MAIYEKQSKVKPGSRSHTRLVVSGGDSPAEQFILDPALKPKFVYEYGDAGQKDIVLGKGMIVGVKPDSEINYETGKSSTIVTFAGKDGAKAIGMAPYNFAKHTNDFLDGNLPAIITREYVEVPLFADATKAAEHNYGAVISDADTSGEVKIGDLVTYSRDEANVGKMIKYDPAKHNETEIVGQVLAVNFDAQVQGWLKWIMFDEAAKNEDLGADKTGYEAPGKGGFPFDPEYRNGDIDVDGYLSQYTSNPTGAPGLLDGKLRGPVAKKQNVTLKATGDATFVIELNDEQLVDGSVVVKSAAGEVIELTALEVDYNKGLAYYRSATEQAAVIEYKANTYGTPAHLDFDGVLGYARVLLRF